MQKTIPGIFGLLVGGFAGYLLTIFFKLAGFLGNVDFWVAAGFLGIPFFALMGFVGGVLLGRRIDRD